jgi:hypothetical protein
MMMTFLSLADFGSSIMIYIELLVIYIEQDVILFELLLI